LVPEDLHFRTMLEELSLSTRQNVQYVRKLLEGVPIDELVVISSSGHTARTRYLFRKLWPEVTPVLTFEAAWQSKFMERCYHCALYAMAVMDPNEKLFFRIKRMFLV
jgi:hypothetical protein